MTDSVTALLPPSWAAWVHGLNIVDIILIAFLFFHALDGMRRGFVAGTLALLATLATLVLAINGYHLVADAIRSYIPVPPLLANIAGFLTVLALARLGLALVLPAILMALRPVRLLLGPLALLDHGLGFAPGLIQAIVIAAVVLVPLRLFPIYPPLTAAIDGSVLAGEITKRVMELMPPLEALLGQGAEAGLLFHAQVITGDEALSIPPVALPTPLPADGASEARMLDLLNSERLRAGLQPLAADERLRQVARQHSEEMLRLGYFSHISPRLGSPAERLQQYGVQAARSAENLAYAPTIEMAHNGLMVSPGHRRNMLTAEYTRVGIGVINAGLRGRMVTQQFAG